jgi:alpha-acetolactate decarboxylase
MSRSFETFMIPYLKFTDFDAKAEFKYNFYTSDEVINENANTLNSSNLYEISLFRRLTSAGVFPRETRLISSARGVPAASS